MDSGGSRATFQCDEDVNNDVNRCTRAGCCKTANGKASPDLCDEHHEDQKRRQRECLARKREQWDAEGKCTRCGGVRYQKWKWCRMCLVTRGRLELSDVNKDVNKARTGRWVDVMEQSPDGVMRARRRFVGQTKRGRRSIADMDGEDLRDASVELALGVDGLKHFHSNEVKRLSKVARDDIEGQALAKLVRASRWIVEVIKRHGYEVPVVVDDDSDEE